MKKLGLVILILIAALSCAFSTNYQKTYLMTDDIWIRANRLCISTGHLGPTPVSPTTGAEILNAIEHLDYNSLTAAQKNEYDYIVSELTDPTEEIAFTADNIILDPTLFLNIEAYAFSHLKDTPVDEFFVPYRDRKPLLNFRLASHFGDIAFLEIEGLYKDSAKGPQFDNEDNLIPGSNVFYEFTNFSFLVAPSYDGGWTYFFEKNGILPGHPIKVGGSFGNDFMNLYIGRTRQEFGNGVTGNLIIGDNYSFQEVVKASFFSDLFTYDLSLTHFDNIEYDQAFKLSGMHQNRLIHRFEFNILNKFRFVFNIGAHILSDSPFDIRMLNPMMIVHNWNNNSESKAWNPNNGDETNNIMGFELEWAFYPGLIAEAQVVIDQFKLPAEKTSTVPSAYGFIINLKHVAILKKGYLESYIEGAYTSPYLYLNKKTYAPSDTKDPEDMWMLDHITGYNLLNGFRETEYSGYTYGPDAIVLSIGTEYSAFDSWTLSGGILFMAHGGYGKEPWRCKDNHDGKNPTTPSGIVEYTLALSVGGSYYILDNLKVDANVYTSFKWNYHNQPSIFRNDIQASVGLSWVVF